MKIALLLSLLLATLSYNVCQGQSTFHTECTWWNEPRCHIGREAENYKRPECGGVIGNKHRGCCYQENLCQWVPSRPGCTGEFSMRAFSNSDFCRDVVPTVRRVDIELPGFASIIVQQEQHFCCKP